MESTKMRRHKCVLTTGICNKNAEIREFKLTDR